MCAYCPHLTKSTRAQSRCVTTTTWSQCPRTTTTTRPQGHRAMTTTCAQSPPTTTTREHSSLLFTHLLTTATHRAAAQPCGPRPAVRRWPCAYSVPHDDDGHTTPATTTWAPSPCTTTTMQAHGPHRRRHTQALQSPHPQMTMRPHTQMTRPRTKDDKAPHRQPRGPVHRRRGPTWRRP